MSRCAGVQPGGPAALQCLQRHAAQLSPNCRSAVAALDTRAPAAARTAAPAPTLASAPPPAAAAVAPNAEQLSAIKFTCQRDFMANCRGVTPGGPEALACLQRNAARVSPNCRTSLAAIANAEPPAANAAPAAPAAAPAARPVGPLRRAIRQRMNQ